MNRNQFHLLGANEIDSHAMEKQKQDSPEKGNSFAYGSQLLCPYPSTLIILTILCSASVLATTGTIALGCTCTLTRLHSSQGGTVKHNYMEVFCLFPAHYKHHAFCNIIQHDQHCRSGKAYSWRVAQTPVRANQQYPYCCQVLGLKPQRDCQTFHWCSVPCFTDSLIQV